MRRRYSHLMLISLMLFGCLPTPAPIVKPEPKPKPSPVVVTSGWVVVVEEQGDRSIDNAVLLGDVVFWRSLKDKGFQYRFYDDDDLPTVQPYLDILKSKSVGEPAMIVIDAKGKPGIVAPLPKDKVGVSKLLGI